MSDKLEALKAAALAATSQDIDTAQTVDSDGHMECPHCSGEGRVDVGGDYCNYDSAALGVLFYGIGDAHVKAEAYFRAAKPAVVLELLAALEEKDQRIKDLEGRQSRNGISKLQSEVVRLRIDNAEFERIQQQHIKHPSVCDGKEQEAFESWAESGKMDMETHPLHWLFLNEKTHAARQGWKAAIKYCSALKVKGE